MASFDPLLFLSLAAMRSDHLGPTAHPAIELGPPRQRRRLEYVKCDFCRRSKKKCEPSKRQWPGEKCQRCITKGFTCSAPTKKNSDVSDALIVVNNSLLPSSEEDLIHEQRAYCALAEKCIQQMCSGLRRNICNLSATYTEIGTIDRSHIDDVLPEGLQYACKFWVSHLCRGKDIFLINVDLQNQVYNFLTGYLLCWLEALSLLQLIQDGINSLKSLEHLVGNVMGSQKLWGLVHDANRFILDYRTDIEHFPLHIYSNALQRSRSGSMKEIHIPRLQNWSELRGGEIWGTQKTILEGHAAMVSDIAFSPDGKLLATASVDSTVRLWGLATQKTLHLLTHDNSVEAIAFSRDGKLLACAANRDSYSWTLKLWDPATGKELQTQSPIKGIGFVNSIAFSPDGNFLASSSGRVVRLWNPATGYLLEILQHDSEPQSITFSPDGKLLASGGGDGIVKLWDPHTGCEMGTFKVYNRRISAIAFSPDSQLLASASFDDNAVNIWDLVRGKERQTFVGHTEGITSVAFSPDGKLLASASYDKMVKLWDPSTGRAQGMIVGRSEFETPIAFSPDGNLLAFAADALTPSGSLANKGTVELWELHNHKEE
ncbi:hypothetical protein V502_07775 [Pseudogymnoascus sp. VKM F-4520 (FW-2644)]|nr:hypothetical protein V502_07775 [Pseudogymnoascus sp. VKM F-4520 (FW-2644)]